MAIKALAWVTDSINVDEEGSILPEVKIRSGEDFNEQAAPILGPYDPAIGAALVNAAIRADVQDYCETNWAVSFGLMDTVSLLKAMDLLS